MVPRKYIPVTIRTIPKYCLGSLKRSPKNQYAATLSNIVLIQSQATFTYNTVEPDKVLIRKKTTPTYQPISLNKSKDEPVTEYFFNAKSPRISIIHKIDK